MHSDGKHDLRFLQVKLRKRRTFPHIEISMCELAEADPVYWFGYPLSDVRHLSHAPEILPVYSISTVGRWLMILKPKVGSAIVSATPCPSSVEKFRKLGPAYAIDLPLEFGMSVVPVIASETGKVFASPPILSHRMSPKHIFLVNRRSSS